MGRIHLTYPVMVACLLIHGSVICNHVSEYWRRDSNVTWQTTTGEVVFTSEVRRSLDCASLCTSDKACLVFGFSKVTGTCHGYRQLQTTVGASHLSIIESTEVIYKNNQSCARAGFHFLQDVHMCVKIFSDPVSWEVAKVSCEMNHGRLAIFNTEQKADTFSEYLDSIAYTNKQIWIGATDAAIEGTWLWLNGEEINPSFWRHVVLNDRSLISSVLYEADCGIISYRYLGDENCAFKRLHYVCERPDII